MSSVTQYMNHNDPRAASFKRAVESADADEIQRLFDAHPELEQLIDKPWFAFGSTALVLSTLTETRAVIDALLDVGADIDAKSDWSVDVELADHLIARGATLDIHAAEGLGRMDVLTELLDAKPERVSVPGPDGATPLHLAMNIDVAQFLLDRGAELDKAGWGDAGGHEDLVELLR